MWKHNFPSIHAQNTRPLLGLCGPGVHCHTHIRNAIALSPLIALLRFCRAEDQLLLWVWKVTAMTSQEARPAGSGGASREPATFEVAGCTHGIEVV